jgi:hypothetical protein
VEHKLQLSSWFEANVAGNAGEIYFLTVMVHQDGIDEEIDHSMKKCIGEASES